ncbi:MAG: hypothetical protein WCJ29_01590 [bacterium]
MDIQKQLEQVFASEQYKKVSEAIKTEFVLSGALLDEHNQLRDADWVAVKEPVALNGMQWKIYIFKFATATNVLGEPTYLSFVRLEPPDHLKLSVETLAKDEVSWQNAIKEYSAAVTGEDIAKVKTDLMQIFETKIFPGKEFHFTPDPQCYGLLPQFDFDFVVPFIGLPSLIKNSGK